MEDNMQNRIGALKACSHPSIHVRFADYSLSSAFTPCMRTTKRGTMTPWSCQSGLQTLWSWSAGKPSSMSTRLSTVQFGVGLGTLCLNPNPHLWIWSSLLPDLNPEVRLRCMCELGAPEVRGLNWAKYGKGSQKKFPAKSLNLWFRCRFSQNSHLLHLEPEPQVQFRFAPGSAGSQTGPQTI